MGRAFSTYLDLVRFVAACLVYLWHSNMRLLVEDKLPASGYGHSAVTVFFVLSGLVIAYATDTKEKTWIDYSASRLSRVYSVVIPAIILTPLLDAAGRVLYPELYAYPWDRFALRIAGCTLMLNEAWFISITYFSNVPYWSIAFEFWYYVLFGLSMFLPRPLRLPAVIGCAVLIGPKLLLLLPVWWSGVVLYRWRWLQQRSLGFAWALVVVSSTGIVLMHWLDLYHVWPKQLEHLIGTALHTNLTFARFFPADYLLGALVFCNFAGMRIVAPTIEPLLTPLEKPVKVLAGYTFTLYLLHQPLLLFWTAVVRGDPKGHGFWVIVTLLTALSVWAIGHFTEQKRLPLRRALQRLFQRLSLALRRPAAAPDGA
ncbi:acyltransferase [Aquincola sp. S2]|uniref:Acyltransferase n=1 Tax=Pseudaquabacterium terrae TaxID=2732868 RepID=A0ABX2EDM9_9BURK|nr:acyltransferase family protein [Aquabacterium terrae]NRF66505.1 acyltransferase [Aquabacterium terrae]